MASPHDRASHRRTGAQNVAGGTAEVSGPSARHDAAAAFVHAAENDRDPLERSGLQALLVESVRDYAIFALDVAGYVLSWNAGAERIKGYAANEIIGRHFTTFYPPEDVEVGKPARELEEAARLGHVSDEGWRIRKDGSRFWASVVITALRDSHGSLVGYGKVTRDLTDHLAAEEALRQSEERLRLLVQTVKDYAIFMLDPSGHVATWNEGARRIKGYAAEEIVGRHFSTFYPPEDVKAGKTDWELEVAQREGRFEDEGWRVRRDGSQFWANVVITALRDATGTLIGFAKVTRDLTERRRTEERTIADARRVAAAEAASRAKSEFLATLSHELRTPLNAIAGYAELIRLEVGGPVSTQHREYLERIGASQKHLLGIINDLLNYSRLEAGHVAYDMRPAALDAVAECVVPMVTPQAVAKQVSITYERGETDVIAFGDQQKVEQIVLNLLSNAVKFTPSGGRVTVKTRVAGDRAEISVSDTGPGVPPDKQSVIFEPFVQLGRSLTSHQEGTGLGLAISRELARAMKGDLVLESSPTTGSVFTLSLPLADSYRKQPDAPDVTGPR